MLKAETLRWTPVGSKIASALFGKAHDGMLSQVTRGSWLKRMPLQYLALRACPQELQDAFPSTGLSVLP